MLALGAVAHASVVAAPGQRPARWKFAHGARHDLPGGPVVFDSYHCSRLNTNTGRLTMAMFSEVVGGARRFLDAIG